jgi:hypothetical protein
MHTQPVAGMFHRMPCSRARTKNVATPKMRDNPTKAVGNTSHTGLCGVGLPPVVAFPPPGAHTGRKEPAMATRQAIQARSAARQAERERLLRPATETVEEYVEWLERELGPEWDKLARDPVRLAQVSLTNYGPYRKHHHAR